MSALLRVDRDMDIYGSLYRIQMKGFKGGHSGTSIHEGRANASLVMGRFLKKLKEAGSVNILDLEGGEKDNAIPNFANAIIATSADEDRVKKIIMDFDACINEEYKGIEDQINIIVTPLSYEKDSDKKLIGDKSNTIIDILNSVPDGVINMCDGIDMVKTSLNLGITKIDADGLKLDFCIRSSSGVEKEELKERVGTILANKGCELALSGDYPGWDYNSDSILQKIAVKAYKEVYGEEPIVTGVHAGLECGMFLEKRPELECVSFGPTISDIHSVKERMSLSSAKRMIEYLLRILENM